MEAIMKVENLPKPKAATHTLRIDIVNKDASTKRIEINFCETDYWSEAAQGSLNIAELIGAYFCDIIANDQYSVGRHSTLINYVTGKPMKGVIFQPQIKSEFIVNNTNS